MGESWRGFQDIEPDKLTRERMLSFLESVDVDAILASVPHGTPQEVAREIKTFDEAGARIATILDYGGMAGQEVRSPICGQGARSRGRSLAADPRRGVIRTETRT